DAEFGDATVKRRVTPLGEARLPAKHLRHHHARLDAFHQERPEVAMERTDVVLTPQAEARADYDGFLTDSCVDAASYLPLTDQDAQSFVERANQLQPVEHLEQLFGRELELGALYRRHGRI